MKRMYSKEELVSLIQQEGSGVTVDSALSGSSKNPVQNKVIKDALDDKQDSLPTVVNDRYLHTNADTGVLEWSEVQSGGGSLYTHYILFKNTNTNVNAFRIAFIASRSEPFTTTADFCAYAYNKGYDYKYPLQYFPMKGVIQKIGGINGYALPSGISIGSATSFEVGYVSIGLIIDNTSVKTNTTDITDLSYGSDWFTFVEDNVIPL